MESESLSNLQFALIHIGLVFPLIPALKKNWRTENIQFLVGAFMFHLAASSLIPWLDSVEMVWYLVITGNIAMGIYAMFFFIEEARGFSYMMFGVFILVGVVLNMMGLTMFLDESVTDDQVLSFLKEQELIMISLTTLQSLLLMWTTFYADWIGKFKPFRFNRNSVILRKCISVVPRHIQKN